MRVRNKRYTLAVRQLEEEYGSKLTEYLPQCVSGTDADAVVADARKCHSQDEDCSYHSVQATLGEDTADESRSLLDLSVNAEPGLVDAFTDETRDHQLDLVHVCRTLDYNHWDDGVFSLERRNEIVSEVIDELFHLKNSVKKRLGSIASCLARMVLLPVR